MAEGGPVAIVTQDGVAVVTIDNPPVNALGQGVRQGLLDAIRMTDADPSVRAVVLACAGRTFIAGADIREFGTPPAPPHLPDLLMRLESASKPWVAAIHGSALGGGLETAMACSHRIAAPGAKLGLPEVTLGVIPGAGGTVRLPRLVSAETALGMIATGKPIAASEALTAGLVDAVAEGELLPAAIALAREAASRDRPVPTLQRPPRGPEDAARFEAEAARILDKAGPQVAPRAAVEALRRALSGEVETALEAERAAFVALRDGAQSAALRHIFFAERAVARIDEAEGAEPAALAVVGVVGGGTMGAGIAAACLLRGLSVILVERDEAAAEAAQARVGKILQGALARGLIDTSSLDACSAAFTTAMSHSALASADLVIEAVFEDMDAKREVFAVLDRHTRADAILASNTSYLDLNEIARAVADPSRVIGLHFFSPAHIMKLLELVIPDQAGPRAVATGAALGRRLGKITVPAGVCDGFIGNRIMSRYRAEADQILLDGATPWAIDAAMRDFGFPMGIYEMQDLAGLDIAWAMRKRRAADRDPAVPYVAVADRLCEAGRFGRKTGRGWYLYETGRDPRPDPKVEAMIDEERRRHGVTGRTMGGAAIMERILGAMQDEARAVLAEGIARRPGDIDVVMVNGYGFPRWRGGPMFMASA